MPKVGYCVHCGTSTHITDVINCDHQIFTALDKIEQEQVKKSLLDRPFHPVQYRGFEVVTTSFDDYDNYAAYKDDDGYQIYAPSLPALLHIIWLITKD